MVSNGNHPLIDAHIDDVLLEEYVLGQLLPNQEEAVQAHLTGCAHCRSRAAKYRAFCHHVSHDLHDELEQANPSPVLDFDRVASQWRKPRRQFNLRYRVQQLVPTSTSLVLVVALLVLAFVVIVPSDETAALRQLDLAGNYSGPPSMVATTTDAGLVILRLDSDGATVVTRLNYAKDVRNLRFSANGEWVAFQEGRTLHILQCRNDDMHMRIEVNGAAEWAWSPDGSSLAYTDGAGELLVYDVITGTSRVIVPADESVWGKPVWSADGHQLAYAVVKPLPATGDPVERQAIWRVDPFDGYRVEVARNGHPEDILLVPTAWVNGEANLLAWDVNAVTVGVSPVLYWVDTAAHYIQSMDSYSLAQGMQLSWPVSIQNITLTTQQDRLYALDLGTQERAMISDQIPWPEVLDWAPNGEWMAYTVAGAPEGNGLFIFALDEHELEQVKLPEGATEKAVFWAGPEHLFVVRQPSNASHAELWLVSLTTGEPPRRVLTQMHLPDLSTHNGWRWGDVIATQIITHD